MKRDQVLRMLLALPFVLGGVSASADDWPNWLGPNRDGKVDARDFDPGFARGEADVKWTADIGVGFSAVTVADGLAYTAGWADGKTTLFAFDAQTGEQKWAHAYPTGKYDSYNIGGTRGSAAIDDGHVYFVSADGVLYCYKAQTGDIVWEINIAKQYGVKPPTWGFSGTPVIIDDIMYLDMGKTLALNKKTGEEIWATQDYGPAYSTPTSFKFKGKDYLAVFPKNGLYVLERDTGKQVAHQPWDTNYGVHAATPVVVGRTILVSSEYNNGCALLEFTGSDLKVVWENRNLRQKMGTPVFHKGTFYGFDSTKLTAVDAKSGKELWDRRGMGHGTVIVVGDTLVVMSDKGYVFSAKASRAAFKPISEAKLIEGDSNVWTSPSLADGRLYVRGSRGKLVCIDVSK